MRRGIDGAVHNGVFEDSGVLLPWVYRCVAPIRRGNIVIASLGIGCVPGRCEDEAFHQRVVTEVSAAAARISDRVYIPLQEEGK